MNRAARKLSEQLAASCVEYLAHGPLGDSRVVVEFTGRFEGHPVLWQATLIALNTDASNQYLMVNVENDDQPQVEIALPVASINEPTVLKAITMVRQYKNLRRGKHEFQGIQKQES